MQAFEVRTGDDAVTTTAKTDDDGIDWNDEMSISVIKYQ